MKHVLLYFLIILAFNLQAQTVLHFQLVVAEQTATEKVYNFIADDFDHIIAWQYNFFFDSTKMRFKEIRNPIIQGLSSGNFNEGTPGVLTTVWLDPDVLPNDYPTPVVAFQIAMELLDPGGSALCFSTDPMEYEIILSEDSGDSELSQLVISDECNTDLLLILNTTAVDDEANTRKQTLEKIYLSKQGELAFTTTQDQRVGLYLYDIMGRQVVLIQDDAYSAGRHSVNTGRPLPEGIYILQIRNEGGHHAVAPVFTY